MPPEEAGGLARALGEAGIDPIFLTAPTSTAERIERIAAMASGFALTVALSWTVESPGDWVERLVPLALATLLALAGARKA